MENRNTFSTNIITSATARNFYSKRKKSPQDKRVYPKIQQALRLLTNRQEKSSRKLLLRNFYLKTQKKDDTKQLHINEDQKTQLKQQIQKVLSKDSHLLKWSQLLAIFQKVTNCFSLQIYQKMTLQFYQTFLQLLRENKCKLDNIQQKNTQQKLKSVHYALNVPSKAHKNSKYQQNQVYFENHKLEKQNILLRKQLVRLNSLNTNKEEGQYSIVQGRNKKGGHFDKESQNAILFERRKLLIKTQQCDNLIRELQALKEQLYALRDQKKSLQQRITELKVKNQNLCSDIITLQLKSKKTGTVSQQNQSIMLMQKQQIESYQYQVFEQRRIYLNLSRKYHGLIQKFRKTKADTNCKIAVLYTRQSQLFPQQIRAFDQLKIKVNSLYRLYADSDNSSNPTNARDTYRKAQKSTTYTNFMNNKQSINNKQGTKRVQKYHYQYSKPTFYHLIAEDISFYGIDKNNYEHFNQSIKLNFVGSMRAIMDCKFNEYLMLENGNYKSLTSFPVFVYSWLHTFQLNQEKVVEQLEQTNTPLREIVSMFYVNLMSEKLNYSWEIITFREFLLEALHADELYYYLGLRFYLLKGDITKHLDSSFQQIYYIEYAKGLQLINTFIHDSDNEYLKIYEEYLKKSLTYINKKSYIDMHFILRLMLEYYQYLKQKEIDKMIKTINTITQNKVVGLNFPDFLKVFEYHFQYMSLSRKIQIYRLCHCIGQGNINFEILMTVLNEENVFVQWVEQVVISQKIKIQDNIYSSQQSAFIIYPEQQGLYQLERQYRYLHNTQIKRQSCRIGIQSEYKRIVKNNKLNNISIHCRVQDCIKICMMHSKKMYRCGAITTSQIPQHILETMEFLRKFSKLTLCRNQISEIMRNIKYKASASKIINFYKKKKQQITRSIMHIYSNNGMQEEEDERGEQLRTQFMNIITNMRRQSQTVSTKIIQ